MSAEEAVPQAAKPEEKEIEIGGSTVVFTQPRQVGYVLRCEEFDSLCEGESDAEDKKWRDVVLGIAITGFVGLICLVGAVDWGQETARKSWVVWVASLILAAGTLAAFGIFCYLQRRLGRCKTSSGYERIKSKIRSYFEQQRD